MAAELHIREEGSGAGYRVWPDPDQIPPGAIQETRTYLFELRGGPAAGNADLLIDELPLEALRVREPGTSRWRWSPGFHAGVIEAALSIPSDGERRFEIVTDPDVRKLTRDDFDGMVREILSDTFALFSLTSFRSGIARGVGRKPPPLARLEFLRSRIDEIEAAVAAIVRHPRRMLQGREDVVPYHRAVRATGPEILKSFRTGRVAQESRKFGRLPEPLQGNLPRMIRQMRRRDSFDLREHRELKACLEYWASWLARIAELLGSDLNVADPERQDIAALWHRRCRLMARRLSALAALPAFREVGNSPARLIMSPVWRNDPNYRRCYQLYRDMNLGIAALTGDFLQMPLARTFELYELWCFIRLVRAVTELFGGESVTLKELFLPDAQGGITLATGAIAVRAKDGLTLCFQRQFREFWREADGTGSFSRTMVPDVTLAAFPRDEDDCRSLIILDAKYRIHDGLNAALNSIHTYRDALVRDAGDSAVEGVVRAAYLLTPHLPNIDDDFRDTSLPGRLFHPDYRSRFRFGAVSLRPGMPISELQSTLETILADAQVAAHGASNG